MYNQHRQIIHANDTEEVLFLNVILHECHCFLQRWQVLIGDRLEETDGAFIAVTELEREVRLRRDLVATRIGLDTVPF